MIIKLSTNFIKNKEDTIFNHVKSSYINYLISWIIDSKLRKAVNLKEWLKAQVDNPSEELIKASKEIQDNKDVDELMYNIFMYVNKTLIYKADSEVWKMNEHWNTANESIAIKTVDCEDGAILMYVLARLKGIPANRLLILGGNVKGGGHCWLGYKAYNYPLNFVFLDWCYWRDTRSIADRNKFYINKTNIYEYSTMLINSNYYSLWFAFNEDFATNELEYKI